MNFADAHRHARERARHELDVMAVIAQKSRDVGCASKDCIISIGSQSKEDFPCVCLDKPHFTFSYAPLFRDILNYLKGNYEAIMPLEESKRLADAAFEKLFPRDEQ